MSSKKNILVTGANGQLGMEFRDIEKNFSSYNFLFASREEISIEDEFSIKKYFREHTIDYCINCAAYTAVDKAETETEKAILINSTAVGNLAAVCKEYNAVFFHFSTDYVFNGQAIVAYKETATPDPVNFYGQTKLMGEHAAIKNNDQSVIIRTSWVYSSYGKNFVKTMLRLMGERESIGVVADQTGCPTYAADLAAAVMKIISGEKFTPGIYHYCNNGIISWYEFAGYIKELSDRNCVVNAIKTNEYPTPAARPMYSALDTQKIQEMYGIKMRGWKESLAECIEKMKNNAN